MKNLYLIEIEGSNIANVVHALKNDFNITFVKSPNEIKDKYPKLILPGNGSFNHYISFLFENGWQKIFEEIIFENKGKLITICSGFQALGISSKESPNVRGLGLFDMNFDNVANLEKKGLLINIGRKEIFDLKMDLKFNDLSFLNNIALENISYPYFVHGFATRIDSLEINKFRKYSCLYANIGEQKILAALVSESFCGTQFHPELSGCKWCQFMLRFLN